MPKRTITEPLKRASRENGKKGGRPPAGEWTETLVESRAEARNIFRSGTAKAARVLEEIMEGAPTVLTCPHCQHEFEAKVPRAETNDRIRAAENFLDRGGAPRLQQNQILGESVQPTTIHLVVHGKPEPRPAPPESESVEAE
jgi:hypothetical protein